MNSLVLTALLVSAMTSPGSPEPPAEPVTIRMVAIEATREGRERPHFDRGLEAIRPAVAELKQYDTFRLLRQAQVDARYGEEVRITLVENYVLCARPVSRDRRGRVRLDTRIERIPPKTMPSQNRALQQRPLRIAQATHLAVPGDKFKFRIAQNDGELVVVLEVLE